MSKNKSTGNAEKRKQKKTLISTEDVKSGSGGELHQTAGGEHLALTTNQGVAISDNQNSLKAHPRGTTLLEDFILRDKITHFDHERIPERIVHARGTGAHGFFELTASLKQYTTARILTETVQIIGKMKDTLEGRAVGILIADGSDGAIIRRVKKAATDAGASAKIIAPKVGGAKLADGSMLAADGQLAGTPSVLFDAVAVILSDEGAKMLAEESAAIDFARDAFGHLKAIAADQGGCALLKTANVGSDAGVVDAGDKDAFIAAAKTRQWDRERSVRTLA